MSIVRSLLLVTALATLVVVAFRTSGSGARAAATTFVAPTDTIPALQTRADSIAKRLVDVHGYDAWQTAPYLRFTFAVEQDDARRVVARHLWNRRTGDYRCEWGTADTTYVALVNVNAVTDDVPVGDVYRNGEALTGDAATGAKKQAYVRFINDVYWLTAPLKVFDPGVNRAYVADSSDATHDVIQLTFNAVGLTPEDTYWLYVNRETGRLDRWAFHLQSMPDDAPAATFDWTDYQTLAAPGGDVHLAERHVPPGGGRSIVTTDLAIPTDVPGDAFTAPAPMLAE